MEGRIDSGGSGAVVVPLADHASDQRNAVRARLQLIGGFSLRWRDRSVELAWGTQRLLALLALRREPARRSYLAGTLWMDSEERRASGNLRSALWRLRSTRNEIVRATPTHVGLSPGVQIDLDDATALADAVMGRTGEVDLRVLDTSVFASDVLPDWYDDWVIFERERFRQLRLHALEALCERQASIGLHAAAIQNGLTAVNADPLRESAHRALIKAYLAERNYVEAKRQYRALADLLMTDLGIEPSEDASKLLHVTNR